MIEDWSSHHLASKELALQALDTRLERWDLRVNKQLPSSLPKASASWEWEGMLQIGMLHNWSDLACGCVTAFFSVSAELSLCFASSLAASALLTYD